MYCPDCSAETVPGLKYCKRCGASLVGGRAGEQGFPVWLTLAFLALIGIIMIVGLVAPFAAFSELTNRGFSVRDLRAMFVLSPIAASGVSGLLVWLLLRLISINKESAAAAEAKREPNYQYGPSRFNAPQESFGGATAQDPNYTNPLDRAGATRERRAPKVRPTR
jgi:hypothetical protein